MTLVNILFGNDHKNPPVNLPNNTTKRYKALHTLNEVAGDHSPHDVTLKGYKSMYKGQQLPCTPPRPPLIRDIISDMYVQTGEDEPVNLQATVRVLIP